MLEDINNYNEITIKYEFAQQTLITELNNLIKEYEHNNKSNIVEHIKTRIKTKESSISKLKRKGYEVNSENLVNHIHDLLGVRIVCSFLSDVYEIVNLIEKSSIFKIRSKDDFIKNPKKSGYSSYHINIYVPVVINSNVEYVEAEIQIRTMAMDFWASLEHKIKYKFDGIIPEEVTKEIYECSIEVKELDEKMFKINEIMNKYK